VTLAARDADVNNTLEPRSSASLDLYATESVFLKGVVNNTEDPHRLAINYTGTATLTAGQSTDFYGTIYAPDAEVLLHQSGNFFGSVVAKQVSVDQSGQFHFDESLADDASEEEDAEITIRSWRQP
jgi:hypothetical protein